MDDSSDNAEKRRHARTEIPLLVQYRFNSLDDFLAEYAVNLSPGGMFIRSPAPVPLGTMLSLHFSLKDGSRLIEGLARVVRVVPPDLPGQESGMGVEFTDFDAETRALVRQICGGQKVVPLPKPK